MDLSSGELLLLLGVALLLAAAGCFGASPSSPHSLRYFHTALSEPGPGLPQFSIVGYVDDQPFTKYDSVRRNFVPLVPWMEEVGKEDPQYWERNTQMAQSTESVFRGNLVTLRERFNQQNSTGLHTLQWMYGCEVGPDGRLRRGHYQFAYDGEDFLAFDRETVRWTAAVPQAEISRQKLDMRQDISQRVKDYLEGTCVEWLRRYLAYGNETLLRTERPTWRVGRKKGHDGQETLFCQLCGFYPKEIEVTWMKDGEDRKPETMSGGDVPNLDGTYNTWLSIDVDPKERDRYRCQVEHDSLLEPLVLAWEEPASHLDLIVIIMIITGLFLLVVSILVGVFAFRRKWNVKCYEAESTSYLDLILSIVALILLVVSILGVVIAFCRKLLKSDEEASASNSGLILGSVGVNLLVVFILDVVFAFRRKLLKSDEEASGKLKEKETEAASTEFVSLPLWGIPSENGGGEWGVSIER
ncbi:PREDICTED: class I histocompatibility antigen, F10 alpha chain-like isoform X2 [Gekko japonicus]|uniref:Class I histocompatibility antigen, F10 alpha chain-like isoform X2 n=1 Tax=Gekko japonicus TaxID=146911 RepID=A0ABM1LCA3_GEKJA|nr:PREDICTED: class I histocompatibility antigen, F10 alpha chain-like isoform X2 [Gekko japonicus]